MHSTIINELDAVTGTVTGTDPVTEPIKKPQQTITKEAINRLLKDVRQILKHPLTENGIYYVHDETDILKGYAMIVGPSETPYFGGYYFFEFFYPCDYPFSPPKVKYMTNNGFTRFNPNLYKCGKVCVSILNTWTGDKWSSCQTINSLLLTLCSLLNDKPFLNEPGQTEKSKDYIAYQKSVTFANINYAVCDVVLNKTGQIPASFLVFYKDMVKLFFKNFDELLSFVETKKDVIEDLVVIIYSMTTRIDYNKLKTKLENVHKILKMNEQKTKEIREQWKQEKQEKEGKEGKEEKQEKQEK